MSKDDHKVQSWPYPMTPDGWTDYGRVHHIISLNKEVGRATVTEGHLIHTVSAQDGRDELKART